MSDRRPFATSEQVADYPGEPFRRLDQRAYSKVGVPYVMVGRHRCYRCFEVEKWLDLQTRATAEVG